MLIDSGGAPPSGQQPGNRQATLDRFSGGWQAFTPVQLATLRLPVLIQWGAHDRIIAVQASQWFQQAIAGSTLTTYPDAGYLPLEEVAQRSADDLSAWLAVHRLPGKPG